MLFGRVMRIQWLLSLSMMIGCAGVKDVPSGSASAGGKADDGSSMTLLDCNTPAGPDQQVTVRADGDSLTLVELTTSGAQISRALSHAEWDSETLSLRDDFGSTSTLAKESGDWVLRSTGGGDNEFAIADCWVDESR